MILAQCDAVISLVDDDYYDRARCSVEVLLVQTLKRTYGIHLWYEHVLEHPVSTKVAEYVKTKLLKPVNVPVEPRRWALQRAQTEMDIDMAEKKLSLESDRPRVMFLERQSRLLGRGEDISGKKGKQPTDVGGSVVECSSSVGEETSWWWTCSTRKPVEEGGLGSA